MNKKSIFLTIAIGALFFSGCGDDEFHAKHNQGKNCLECHSFKGGGTIFKSIDAKDYDEKMAARGYNIQLLLKDGTIIKYSKGNGYGNRKYSGNIDNIGNFTAQIVDQNGTVVNHSRENSHNIDRLACNRCHTKDGANGAPGRVVNFNFYDNNQNFGLSSIQE